MIKAIIFDCFGVLTGDKWKEFVATVPEDHRAQASDLNRRLDKGEIDGKEFLKNIHELTNVPIADINGILNAEMHKNRTLLEYIAELKKNYMIGLLSNVSSDWIHNFLTKEELSLFDDLVLSYQVGMTKHDQAIYKFAADRLKVNLNESVLIDDNANYCKSAQEQGMKAILYQDFPQMKRELQAILVQ